MYNKLLRKIKFTKDINNSDLIVIIYIITIYFNSFIESLVNYLFNEILLYFNIFIILCNKFFY